MNLQAHLSARLPGQTGPPINGIPQQNGNNSVTNQLQSVGVHRNNNAMNMDPDFVRERQNIQKIIYKFLVQRQQQPQTIASKKVMDIVRRLEEGLFKAASTKEEYLNLETLESRLHILIKQLPLNNHNNQQFPQQQHLNSSSSAIGTMIPTPGMMPQNVNSNLMVTSSSSSVVDNNSSAYNNNNINLINNSNNSMTSSSGNFIPTPTASFNSSNGQFSNNNGYQQSPSNFSINSGGGNNINGMVSSAGVQRIGSQMIPTPGFNNGSNNMMNNNQSYVNMENSATNNGVGFSSIDPIMASQSSQQQKLQQHQQQQQVVSQNSQMLHSLGRSSGLQQQQQQKSYAFSNGTLNGGLGMINSNSQTMNGGPGASEGYLTTGTLYGNLSTMPLQQHFDQNQRQISLGDRYGNSLESSSGSGNFNATMNSSGSMMANNQNLNSGSLQSLPKITNQSNLQNIQQAINVKASSSSSSIDQSEKMSNFQSPHLLRESFVQSQFQQKQSHHFQPQQLVQHQQQQQQQRQQKQQPNQQRQQHPLKNDAFGQSLLQADLANHVKLEPGIAESANLMRPEQFQSSSSSEIFALQSGPHDLCSSQQMDQLLQQHHNQFVADSQNDFISNPIMLQEQDVVKEEFRQRISGREEAQRNNLSSDGGSIISQNMNPNIMSTSTVDRERDYRNQQRWLLFLKHARSCKFPEGKCPEIRCLDAQKLWKHVERCNMSKCLNPRCHPTKTLLKHRRECVNPSCPVCIPVKNFCMMQQQATTHTAARLQDASQDSPRLISRIEDSQQQQPPPFMKRMKIEQQNSHQHQQSQPDYSVPVPIPEPHHLVPLDDHQRIMPMKIEVITGVKMEMSIPPQGSIPIVTKKENIRDVIDTYSNTQRLTESDVTISNDSAGFSNEEKFKAEKETVEQEVKHEITEISKSGKPKIKGVSLTELFTPEQVREHISGLRRWVGQSKAKAEKNQAMEHSMSENSCQLCAVEKLTFEPPPIYCTPCGARIKRNAMYYTIGTGDTRHFFCIPCFNEARGETIMVDTSAIPKSRLEKKKNDEETEEWWVQCDKCEAWQHQICALFNGRRNDGGQAEYTCPNCYIEEVERGERTPLPQSAVLGAKDLPRTILSDHIEQRLFRRLRQERSERARVLGKTYDEVPGAESLVVRVVSSVDKKLEVKPRFLEIFREDNYPSEFAYKSKVVLLFQKIEGVEVCLFGMYVQEFGSECLQPNHRRVYLSYLDSVKYFRPEIKAVTGEALRTFVYHEILIGYLEYCKKRGFTSCYIWACPPLKGEDYILYCHPEIQKTPKSDKLREWYLAMLRKATKENIVVELTNLYDHFFVTSGECKARVTAARLPYFDGDYWPGAAEDIIYQIRQEEDGRKLNNKKGTIKKLITKRALKASGQTDLSGNASKDLLLMHKLGESISSMKEDFIMVHLQHACTHCCLLLVSGTRWVCSQCKNFQLCDKCYEAENQVEERERHPINHREKHALHPVDINNVTVDTKDKDEILESEFFDTRQAFLSLCQGNHYQYDTLRRAKHSSMMVLYHLHNPTAPAFVTTCNMCHLDIETGQGWRCEICPDYDVCNACFQKDGGIDHPHKLTNHPSIAERDAQNKEARQMRVDQLRKMLELLVHASQCRSPNCQYPNCRKVKGLFRHGIQCKTRASGGCPLCKKMWYLLQLHSRACKESECHVPRCKDLKEHMRRLQQQSDSRRRAAVMEMMRQRAAEVATGVAV
jgi:E1A/CREB-binding protein